MSTSPPQKYVAIGTLREVIPTILNAWKRSHVTQYEIYAGSYDFYIKISDVIGSLRPQLYASEYAQLGSLDPNYQGVVIPVNLDSQSADIDENTIVYKKVFDEDFMVYADKVNNSIHILRERGAKQLSRSISGRFGKLFEGVLNSYHDEAIAKYQAEIIELSNEIEQYINKTQPEP